MNWRSLGRAALQTLIMIGGCVAFVTLLHFISEVSFLAAGIILFVVMFAIICFGMYSDIERL